MPEQATLRFWKKEAKAPSVPWAEVEQRLESTPLYWLVTSGADGTPCARPVWGAWFEDRLLLTVGSFNHWRNIETNSKVSVHLEDALNVVIVEGTAVPEQDTALLCRFVEVYNPKYQWDLTGETTGGVIAVEPRKIVAWKAAPTEESKANEFPLAAGKWEFSG